MKVVALDLETTGLDWTRHEIWEVAAVAQDGSRRELLVGQLAVDESRADPTALKIGRFGVRQNRNKWRDPASLAQEIVEFTRDVKLVVANPAFDIAFLTAFLALHELEPAWHYRIDCVQSRAAGAMGWPETRSLRDTIRGVLGYDYYCDWVGHAHSALADALGALDVWSELAVRAQRAETLREIAS